MQLARAAVLRVLAVEARHFGERRAVELCFVFAESQRVDERPMKQRARIEPTMRAQLQPRERVCTPRGRIGEPQVAAEDLVGRLAG